jgi:hypothetical protein
MNPCFSSATAQTMTLRSCNGTNELDCKMLQLKKYNVVAGQSQEVASGPGSSES